MTKFESKVVREMIVGKRSIHCDSQKKLDKARAERIWIEENHDIHVLNYPYHKLKRWLKRKNALKC